MLPTRGCSLHRRVCLVATAVSEMAAEADLGCQAHRCGPFSSWRQACTAMPRFELHPHRIRVAAAPQVLPSISCGRAHGRFVSRAGHLGTAVLRPTWSHVRCMGDIRRPAVAICRSGRTRTRPFQRAGACHRGIPFFAPSPMCMQMCARRLRACLQQRPSMTSAVAYIPGTPNVHLLCLMPSLYLAPNRTLDPLPVFAGALCKAYGHGVNSRSHAYAAAVGQMTR